MIAELKHLTMPELEAGLDNIRNSPKDEGRLELIVRRPRTNEREVLATAALSVVEGLVGDKWIREGSSSTPDGSPNLEMQVNIMNVRVIALVAQQRDRWPLAGDQLYIDLDLSTENLPPGTRLAIGSAVLEITSPPHTGCKKFLSRFGVDAVKFVNSPVGRQLNMRGVNARVIQSGEIRVSDIARKLAADDFKILVE